MAPKFGAGANKKQAKRTGGLNALPVKAEGALMAAGEVDSYIFSKSRVDFSINALFDELSDIYPFEQNKKLASFTFNPDNLILKTNDGANWILSRELLEMTAIDRFNALVAYAESDNLSRRAAGIAELERRRASLEREIEEIDAMAAKSLRPDRAVSIGALEAVVAESARSSNIFEQRYLPGGRGAPMADHICHVLSNGEDEIFEVSYCERRYPYRLTFNEAMAFAEAYCCEKISGHDLYDRTIAEVTAAGREAGETLYQTRKTLVQLQQGIARHQAIHGQDGEYRTMHQRRVMLERLRIMKRGEANEARMHLRMLRLWKRAKRAGGE